MSCDGTGTIRKDRYGDGRKIDYPNCPGCEACKPCPDCGGEGRIWSHDGHRVIGGWGVLIPCPACSQKEDRHE